MRVLGGAFPDGEIWPGFLPSIAIGIDYPWIHRLVYRVNFLARLTSAGEDVTVVCCTSKGLPEEDIACRREGDNMNWTLRQTPSCRQRVGSHLRSQLFSTQDRSLSSVFPYARRVPAETAERWLSRKHLRAHGSTESQVSVLHANLNEY